MVEWASKPKPCVLERTKNVKGGRGFFRPPALTLVTTGQDRGDTVTTAAPTFVTGEEGRDVSTITTRRCLGPHWTVLGITGRTAT